ncbi:hypothetical protein [Paenibacillus sp. YAF4_2]|uniref:hypothetical protein n=1 Tax=Paenibacillus sp. YAF4_2 TaxID=3233085 RepID=UPI003F9B567A
MGTRRDCYNNRCCRELWVGATQSKLKLELAWERNDGEPSECMQKAAGSGQVHRYGIPPSSGVQAGSDLLAAKPRGFIIAA